RAAVHSRHTFEQGSLERIVRKGRLDGVPRDVLQLTLSHAEALSRHGVFAADASAEVRWIVRAQCELHTGFVQPPKGVFFVAGVHECGDVRGGAGLERYAPFDDLIYEVFVLGGSHTVTDPGDRKCQCLSYGFGAGVLAGVDGATEPRGVRDLVGGS